jgi:hypothetical protein
MKPSRSVQTPTRQAKGQGGLHPDVQAASQEYTEENQDILLAVEAMRRSQLVQEQRVKHLLRQQPYYSIQ